MHGGDETRLAANPGRCESRDTGVVQHAAGVAPRVRSLLEEDLAVHHDVVDALGQLAHPPAVVREVVHHVLGNRLHGIGTEDDESVDNINPVLSQSRPRLRLLPLAQRG